MPCARCGAGPAIFDQFDYCALCGQTLCDDCMAAGCCGNYPAISGKTQDADPHAGGEAPSDATSADTEGPGLSDSLRDRRGDSEHH